MGRLFDDFLDLLRDDPLGVAATLALALFWPELTRLFFTAIAMGGALLAP